MDREKDLETAKESDSQVDSQLGPHFAVQSNPKLVLSPRLSLPQVFMNAH